MTDGFHELSFLLSPAMLMMFAAMALFAASLVLGASKPRGQLAFALGFVLLTGGQLLQQWDNHQESKQRLIEMIGMKDLAAAAPSDFSEALAARADSLGGRMMALSAGMFGLALGILVFTTADRRRKAAEG